MISPYFLSDDRKRGDQSHRDGERRRGYRVAHYDMIYLKPLDEELLHEIGQKYNRIITVENGVIKGGLVALSLSLWQTMAIRLM